MLFKLLGEKKKKLLEKVKNAFFIMILLKDAEKYIRSNLVYDILHGIQKFPF